jgi:Putative zinc-finger
MTCVQARSMLSAYLDGAITGQQMLSLGQHFENCGSCEQEYESLRRTQQLLTNIGRAKAPQDLSLKLRLAISREVARSRQPYFGNLALRLENAMRGFMVPATAGLVATIAIFALLMGFITPVQADTSDVPLLLSTKPELQQSSFGMTLGAISEDSLVIEAYVDANGRVQDYRILSDPNKLQDLPHPVKNMLIFTTFRPATSMGMPRPGTAVLSFSKISVKG